MAFLQSLAGLPPELERLVGAALAVGERPPAGDWLGLAGGAGEPWPAIAEALRLSIS